MTSKLLSEYPGKLSSPLLSGYGLNQQSNLLRTKMDSGHARVRRRFISVPTIMTATWNFRSNDAAIFEGFITHALYGGSAWFLMDILTPLGIAPHEVRFKTNPLEKCKFIDGTWWEYQADVEVNNRAIMSEQQTVEAVLASNTSTQFTNGVKDAVESYQE